jgi:hypothetical protein
MIALATRNGRMPRTSISPRLASILAEREAILDERDYLLDRLQLLRARLRLNLGRLRRRRRRMLGLASRSRERAHHGEFRPSPGYPLQHSHINPR